MLRTTAFLISLGLATVTYGQAPADASQPAKEAGAAAKEASQKLNVAHIEL